jgi:hypothetical protein
MILSTESKLKVIITVSELAKTTCFSRISGSIRLKREKFNGSEEKYIIENIQRIIETDFKSISAFGKDTSEYIVLKK